MAWQRNIPFGYQMQNGMIDRHPVEAQAVRDIFAKYLAGSSLSQIAECMMEQGIPYHRHTPQWNKNMVKRILENQAYLGAKDYPHLVSDEDFLAVQLLRRDKNTYKPCPADIDPIRKKAVCGLCGARMLRDTKTHGRAHWRCQDPECCAGVYIADDILQEKVSALLHELAASPALLVLPDEGPRFQTDALRIESEINLCFNRGDVNAEYMKTLIFAAAAERYAALPDPTPVHDLEELCRKSEQRPADEDDLRELLDRMVKAIRIGTDGGVALELVNGATLQSQGEEETA